MLLPKPQPHSDASTALPAHPRWKIAKIMARWEPAKGAPWEVSECEGEHKESEDEDSKNVD